jgi:amphi-Trp domain-containing protein
VSNLNDRQGRGLSRQEAAERLIDVAYALAAGGKLSLDDDQEVDVPFAGEVTLERQSISVGGHTELAIKLSWPEGP